MLKADENMITTDHVIRDIQAAADQRCNSFEKDFEQRVEDTVTDLIREGRLWETSGVGDSIVPSSNPETFDGNRSIFEIYDSTISAGGTTSVKHITGKGKKKSKKYKSLDVSEWTNAGLAPYEDPNNIQTIDKLRLQQSASLYQYINYPIARSEIENLARYTLGRGIKIDCLVEDINKVLTNFWRENKMELRQKKSLRSYLLDGEYFPMLFNNYSENIKEFDSEYDSVLTFRSIASTEISEVELDSEDMETTLSYLRSTIRLENSEVKERIYLDVSHPFGDEKEFKLPTTLNGEESKYASDPRLENPDKVRVMFFKHSLEHDIRGRVVLEPILKWNRVAVDFLYSRARLNHLRSKIYLVETNITVAGKRQETTTKAMPKGGVKLIESADRKFRFLAPETGAQDAETDYNMILYMIGSALSMPIHILNMNAENENYASIKEAANPFAQAILDLQDEWGEHTKNLLRYVIKSAIRAGVLKPEYTVEFLPEDIIGEVKRTVYTKLNSGSNPSQILQEMQKVVEAERKTVTIKTVNIPLSVVFPNMVQSDPEKEAKALEIFIRLGILSKYTATLKAGFDPDVEASRIAVERDIDMEKEEERFNKFNNGSPDFDKDAKPDGGNDGSK